MPQGRDAGQDGLPDAWGSIDGAEDYRGPRALRAGAKGARQRDASHPQQARGEAQGAERTRGGDAQARDDRQLVSGT